MLTRRNTLVSTTADFSLHLRWAAPAASRSDMDGDEPPLIDRVALADLERRSQGRVGVAALDTYRQLPSAALALE